MAISVIDDQRNTTLQHVETLLRIIASFSGVLEIETLQDRIVESMADLLDAANGTIWLVNGQSKSIAPQQRSVTRRSAERSQTSSLVDRSLAETVLRERRVVYIGPDAKASSTVSPESSHLKAIALPITVDDEMVAVVGLELHSSSHLSHYDIEVATLLGRHAAIALGNARLFEAEQRRRARTLAINRVGHLINSSLSLDTILQTAVEAIREHLQYHHAIGVLLLVEDDPQMLELRAYSGAFGIVRQGEYRQHIEQGIIGLAARTRQLVLVNDAQNDPRYLVLPGLEGTYGALAVPIVVDEHVFGVLNIESAQQITDEDAADFDIIADQLAIALRNASRYEEERKRTERLELIARISQRIAMRLDPDELFITTVDELHGRMGYDHAAIFVPDPADASWLVKRATTSRWPGNPPGHRQSIMDGVIGAAGRERVPVLVNDVATDTRFVPVPDGNDMQAELAVPILLRDRLLGVLDVAGVERFREEDVTGLRIIADQLAVAIDNARLFTDTQQVLSHTELLYSTSHRISTAMSVKEVIAAYLDQVAVRGRYACLVALHEMDVKGQKTGTVIRGQWLPGRGVSFEPLHVPFIVDELTPLLDAGLTVTVSDVRTDPRISDVVRVTMERVNSLSLAIIPLMVRDTRIGEVVLFYPKVYRWPEQTLQPYQTTAAQLAGAIDSRQQYVLLAERGQQIAVFEERQRLARELHDSVTQSLFSMSLMSQVLPDLWKIDQNEARQALHQIQYLTRAALAEMRALLIELRPANPDGQRLALVIQEHIAAFEHRTRVRVKAELNEVPQLPDEVVHTLMRIAQEALNNIARHAQAQHVRVLLEGNGPVRLLISDDGQGFDPQIVGRTSFGLVSMRERAANINAQFDMKSIRGQGTEIIVTWSSPNEAG